MDYYHYKEKLINPKTQYILFHNIYKTFNFAFSYHNLNFNMFEYIRGTLTQLTPTYAILDTGGIGYFLNISLNTYSILQEKELKKEIKLFTHNVIREDANILYGFINIEERHLFRQLITVSGIGANTARMMLSSMTTEELVTAIAQGDVNALKGIKGIGLKTAQRIIVELKDKISSTSNDIQLFPFSNNTMHDEALSALVMLGFPKKTVEKIIQTILQKTPNIGLEDLIKSALKLL